MTDAETLQQAGRKLHLDGRPNLSGEVRRIADRLDELEKWQVQTKEAMQRAVNLLHTLREGAGLPSDLETTMSLLMRGVPKVEEGGGDDTDSA